MRAPPAAQRKGLPVNVVFERRIPRPTETVFPCAADPERAKHWRKNIKQEKILLRTPEVVGTTFTETIQEYGGRLEMRGRITRYEDNRLIGFHIDGRIHAFDKDCLLVEKGGGTKFSERADARWRFPMNIIGWFLGSKMRADLLRQIEAETLELKEICEAGV
jgi:uncharacterized protein YndB with AHSA1/START domain